MFEFIGGLFKALYFWFYKKVYKVEAIFNHLDSPEDLRDYIYTGTVGVSGASKVDLRPQFTAAYNQGSISSCTANAISSVYQYTAKKQLGKEFMPSRLGLYYDERKMEGSVLQDAGAYIRDGMKICATQGLYPEFLWPYDVKKVFVAPPASCYKEAIKHQSLAYEKVPQKLQSLCSALNCGYPIVFGFKVYSNMMATKTASTGVLNLPGTKDKLLGGHAVTIVGYDTTTQRFIVRNSWGTLWGQKGYFTMPFEYVLNPNLASDFWIMKKVEG